MSREGEKRDNDGNNRHCGKRDHAARDLTRLD